MKPRSKSFETIVSQLSTGYGAQRLPSALRAIEIQDVPSRGALKGQQAFLRDVLPKIKYHNNQLSIMTEWKKMPQRKKRSGKEASTSEVSSETTSSTEHVAPLIRLHFGDDLPTQELLMGDKSSRQIAIELTALIQKTVGGPVMTEEELNEATAMQKGEDEGSLAEEARVASESNSDPASIPTTDSEPHSASTMPASA